MEADALSTSLFVAGIREGLAILRQCPGAEAIFIPDQQPLALVMTAGLVDRFEPLESIKGRVDIVAIR